MHSLSPPASAFARRRAFFIPRCTALVLALCGFAAGAWAQDALLDKAAALLSRQDAAGAYALLSAAESERAGDARFDYLLGVAALDAGHVTRAIFALERVVQRHPDDMLAHAELGRAYLAAGDVDSARQELRLARSGKLPQDASASIERVLGVIDQVSPSAGPSFSAYLELGLGSDSNVNSATNQGEFAIPGFGGILFSTSPESRQRHDLFALAAGGGSADFTLSPTWKLATALNFRHTVNRDVHDLNIAFVDATVGLRRTVGSQSQTVAIQNGTAWVGSELYRSANGLTGQWQWQLDAASQASVFGQWSHQAYKGQSDRNTDRTLAGVGYARDFKATGLLAYGSAYVARERAASEEFAHFGHQAHGLRLGAEQRFAPALVGFAEWQHERRRYGGTEPFFDTRRRERQSDLSAGVRYSADSPWQLLVQLRHTRAQSNVVFYDYTRDVFQVVVHRNFQ